MLRSEANLRLRVLVQHDAGGNIELTNAAVSLKNKTPMITMAQILMPAPKAVACGVDK
jgi:hypothetical protein